METSLTDLLGKELVYNNLKLVLEGLIQRNLQEQLTECSSVTYVDAHIKIQENIGYIPFLVEVYFSSGCKFYMARRKIGYYELSEIEEDKPRLGLTPCSSISKVIGIHIVLPSLEAWKDRENRLILTTGTDTLLVDVYSPKGSNLILLEKSLFFYTSMEDFNNYREQVRYIPIS